MTQSLSAVTLLVPDYDQAIDYYVSVLGFNLVEDTALSLTKRWVVVSPSVNAEPGLNAGPGLMLAKADTDAQTNAIGHQAGDRIFLFLGTDDFATDHARYVEAGVEFLEEPRHEAYGIVAVFRDAFGNKWDLIERKPTT
ncbi:MAG: VOC family protein [Alphaproteobacteria bacterium]|jgi:catechol 2,3-dioxygenase-like lactoylglutathione lyase family enzyme|nr:VOC family protein [Alphaproteobacteria bacterium]MBT4017667.1 VOC family protein [Alphaproteobacteria bacterium]MBT4964799.1 VOC family protein [Alphaproteobacteria bacterium]MBT5162125.1 VOC family protein [Alphaproteobacteria bacterium]MBT5919409.1 VOC family protein [Alphaproteobacteria bacterium]